MLSELSELKKLLGINDESMDDKLQSIIDIVTRRLELIIGYTVPPELSYIITEVSIARFNRIGSEGMSSHSVDGESINYVDDDFAPYLDDIRAWQDAQDNPRRGRVRFL